MKTITKEDIKNLRSDFDKYTKTAEQYEFPMLIMVDMLFRKTIKNIENGTYNIEENQKDLRAMFRCVLKAIDKDFSEYKEEKIMYIRTKDEIYEVEKEYELKNSRYFEEGKYYNIKSDIAYIDIPEKLVVKTADTIEELCDEFVYCYRNDMPILVYEEQIKQLMLLGRIQDVRGAIWTSKGLIYVAKMNEKGELELL